MTSRFALSFLATFLLMVSAMPGLVHQDGQALVVDKFSGGADTKEFTFTSAGENSNTFTFDIVFAIVKWKNGEIKFVTTNLAHLISSSIPTHRLTVHMSISNTSNS